MNNTIGIYKISSKMKNNLKKKIEFHKRGDEYECSKCFMDLYRSAAI